MKFNFNPSKSKILFFFWFCLVHFFIFVPKSLNGAILYLEPTSGQFFEGDSFVLKVKIDSEGECINTVKATLNFSQDLLEAIDFSTGDSILTLWLKFPEIDQKNGKISFIGGIPGGYCSLNAQKDTPNLLLKVAFRPKKSSKGIAFVEFEKDSEVLLNDGKATPAKLSFKEAKFEIFSQFPETPKKEWEEELAKDTVLPEPFEIEIHRDPSVFEGKYFIVFFTTDKQTGIDHYEIKEGERDWKLAKSPYLLEDQSLKSKILVKAVDKAGNERIVEFNPYQKRNFNWFLVSILFLIAILITWYFINKAVIKVEK